MLTFSIATNWDENLIKAVNALDSERKVTEVFGKLASDFVGGGRPTYALPFISRRNASSHIKSVKNTGRKFNYLLNATCLGNREFTREGQRQIRNLLSWLDSLEVDAVTVANPYLGSLIKKQYPRFELVVSTFASTDSLRQIKFWVEEIGADKITLPVHKTNRNFPLLKKIRAQLNCQLQLIANNTCLYDCPSRIYHAAFLSHASQSHHLLRGFAIDWYLINCRYRLLTRPEEFIKSSWIRPEDVGYYESMGIDSLKIID
ncbi:MAG: U32 family peptidase, partial [Candidatus Omnitrophota bacterium]